MAVVTAEAKVARWGNSQGVRIRRGVIDAAGLSVGDDVLLSVEDGRIVVSALRTRPRYRRAGRRSIEEVFAGYEGPAEGAEWLVGRVGAEALDD